MVAGRGGGVREGGGKRWEGSERERRQNLKSAVAELFVEPNL